VQYTVIESDGDLVKLTRPQWLVLQQAKSSECVQANVQALRKLRDMGFVVGVDYLKPDERPFATFTPKAKRIVFPPTEAAIRRRESKRTKAAPEHLGTATPGYVMQVCSRCDGTAVDPEMPDCRCDVCGGTGEEEVPVDYEKKNRR